MKTSASSLNSYTCITCHVTFKHVDVQRQHYKTDWHRYNLKRKVAELPHVSAEEFQYKLYKQENYKEISKQDQNIYCQVCRKTFGKKNAFDNHLNSKKHKENEKSYVETEIVQKESDDCEIEEVDSDEWEDDTENPVDNNDCLFCLHHSRNFFKNLEHMTTVHSFFIPDVEYCVDIQGLLRYLGEKIYDGFICLWCNEKGRSFYSADAARKHMIDKGHCKMLHEGLALAEYVDYYDYSSSYPDADDQVDVNEEITVPELESTDYQLVLPSGIIVGHRSLMKYYKQSIIPNSTVAVPSKNTKKIHKVLASYRALGWTETQQEAASRKARDLHYMKRMQAKSNLMLGTNANKLQKHYRPQVNF